MRLIKLYNDQGVTAFINPEMVTMVEVLRVEPARVKIYLNGNSFAIIDGIDIVRLTEVLQGRLQNETE